MSGKLSSLQVPENYVIIHASKPIDPSVEVRVTLRLRLRAIMSRIFRNVVIGAPLCDES